MIDGLHAAHLMVVAAWGGLVAGELLFEYAGRGEEGFRQSAARFHRLTDLYVEVPLLLGVVLTGTLLLLRSEVDLGLGVKVACGLGAVLSNVACLPIVFRRARLAREGEDGAKLDRMTGWIFRLAGGGVPLGLVALGLGGHRAGWW